MTRSPWFALALGACIENDFSSALEPDPVPDDTAAPSDPVHSDPVDPDPVDPEVVPCDDLQTLTVSLAYPARQDCPWGIDDNLPPENEHNRARVEEVHDLVLPSDAQLCDLSVRSLTDDLLFDDHVTFTLDDVLLVGGGSGYDPDILPIVDDLRRYRWDTIVGVPFRERDESYFCLGAPESTCVLPETEVAGPLEISLSAGASEALVAAMVGRTTLPFRLVTFGDDNEDDCAHTDLTLEISVAYTLR